jgi:hypothetical protein
MGFDPNRPRVARKTDVVFVVVAVVIVVALVVWALFGS